MGMLPTARRSSVGHVPKHGDKSLTWICMPPSFSLRTTASTLTSPKVMLKALGPVRVMWVLYLTPVSIDGRPQGQESTTGDITGIDQETTWESPSKVCGTTSLRVPENKS